ncbi:hypothetical protein KQY30_31850 [Streptomyces sp. GMY02]|uniref:hypothetical protein n=1 Tax=Streptomyces sp. GMY02 TaxID=1333528 RepID=UPI001C2C5A96|nr:hypothetical protein [Streptomyces sp. GMY02]QXE38142.1 hypothetical protein KQY30_31850 [Streptomyces sp. GMY02]
MADGGGLAAPDGAERLAAVCAHLEEIRADLRDGPGGEHGPVERVLAAAHGGGDVVAPLAVLHAVLQAGGDPQGLDGYTDHAGAIRGLRPAGISTTRAEQVYLCPAGRCARYWWPKAAAPVPHCAISNSTLRRERL